MLLCYFSYLCMFNHVLLCYFSYLCMFNHVLICYFSYLCMFSHVMICYVVYTINNKTGYCIVANESEWAEHMYVVFACYVPCMLLCIISFRVLDQICRNKHCLYLMPGHGYYSLVFMKSQSKQTQRSNLRLSRIAT